MNNTGIQLATFYVGVIYLHSDWLLIILWAYYVIEVGVCQ